MKKLIFIPLLCLLLPYVFSQKLITSVIKDYGVLDYKADVRVYNLNDSLPSGSEIIGTLKTGDNSFAMNCEWQALLETAKLEARQIGGNAIKITEHLQPNAVSTCPRIKANILRFERPDTIPIIEMRDSATTDADYALLHVYRYSGAGALIGYDLHLGDSVICRVSNKWKKTFKIREEGLKILWAQTEVKKEVSVNFQHGKEYYLKCGITMGVMVGHPKLVLVDNTTGKAEYASLKLNKSAVRDIITTNDGKEIECVITGEDENNWYVDIFRNGKKVKTQVQKIQVKSVDRGSQF